VKGKWSANIAKDGRKYHLGYFDEVYRLRLDKCLNGQHGKRGKRRE